MSAFSERFVPPDDSVDTRGAGPLKVQLAPLSARAGALPVPEEEWRALVDCVAWREKPPFGESGRSALAVRREPLVLGDDRIAGYKLKGIGFFDAQTGIVEPPKDQAFQRKLADDIDPNDPDIRNRVLSVLPQILIHMGVNDQGHLYPVPDTPKPKGGLSHGRGQREFDNAVALHQAGVLACTPVLWGRYPELIWQDQPMQWVVLGQSSVDPRVSECFEFEFDERGGIDFNGQMKRVAARQFESFDPSRMSRPALNITESLGLAIGKALRAAHDKAGVARFAGHLGNFTYVPESRAVMMHDFDSSVRLADLAPNARGMTRLRDLDSAMFGLLHSIVYSRIFFLVNDEALFSRKNPVGQILRGYFHDVDAGSELQEVGGVVTRAAKEYGFNTPPHEQAQWLSLTSRGISNQLMVLASRIYERSDLNDQDRLPFLHGQLLTELQRFHSDADAVFNLEARRVAQTLPDWARSVIGL